MKSFLLRLFSNDSYKGQINYINSQKKIEIFRTCLYFGLSLAIFLLGLITTKSRMNLLTIVAVLGCLPASKALVEMIMFLKFNSCKEETVAEIEACESELISGYDFVFTSYDINFSVAHITVVGNTVCGYTEDKNFKEQEFYKHITDILKLESYKDVSIKVFTDLKKYTNRINELKQLDNSNIELSEGIMRTIKSVSL